MLFAAKIILLSHNDEHERVMRLFINSIVFSLMFTILLCSLPLSAQNKINSRLFYSKPPLFNSKSKAGKIDFSLYDITVTLPVDEREKYYGEVIEKNKKTHFIEDFFESPTMNEIQKKMKSDFSVFNTRKKHSGTQKKITINSTVEVFYPMLEGFVNRKSFAKVRLAITALLNDQLLINRKYESVYITNGVDNEFEGNVLMTAEEGENVTIGMALRKTLDQFYSDLNKGLTLDANALIIYGKTLNSKTNTPLSATINFKSDSPTSLNSNPNGSFELILSKNKYTVQVVAPDFLMYSEAIDFTNLTLKLVEYDIKLKPIETGSIIKLQNVLFQVGTSTLLEESFPELNDVVKFLKKNPKVKIELQGHTDNQGSAQKDLELSQQRVEKIKSYLTEHGIKSGRIKGKGFGNSRPIASNADEAGRKLNRRVEFVILKK